jgi:hypothetical protein
VLDVPTSGSDRSHLCCAGPRPASCQATNPGGPAQNGRQEPHDRAQHDASSRRPWRSAPTPIRCRRRAARHVVVGRLGYVDPRLGPAWLGKRDRHAGAYEPGGGGRSSRGDVVQSSSLPVVLPATPSWRPCQRAHGTPALSYPRASPRRTYGGKARLASSGSGEPADHPVTGPRSTTTDLAPTVTVSPAPSLSGVRMPVGSKLSSSGSQT